MGTLNRKRNRQAAQQTCQRKRQPVHHRKRGRCHVEQEKSDDQTTCSADQYAQVREETNAGDGEERTHDCDCAGQSRILSL
jgi:hypothetical protein